MRRSVAVSPTRSFPQLHPVLARIYAARSVCSPDQVDYALGRLYPFDALSGIERAVDLLVAALAAQQHILIVADFDADGATACAVAVRGLRKMGARHVDFLVPNRFTYGYGLTPEIVEVAAQRHPDLLVTVDNGISSVDGVVAAKALGIRVLVTDHHLPGPQLPPADAIVNPNSLGDAFLSKNLAGVGVIFYVLIALRCRLRQQGWFIRSRIPEPNLADLLDLVALGTVADLVPLDHNNRIMVAQGLERIRAGRSQPGVGALLQVAGRIAERVTATDLAYAVGPRLNAAGRLTDMSLGINCLLTDDWEQALAMATQLDQLNRARREIESVMQHEALAQLSDLEFDAERGLPYGLCLFREEWHQGIIGLLASRIKDRVHRPVIAFAAQGDAQVKGSARSVPGLHIRDTLNALATREPGLITKFGGHAMAAGLSLRRSDLDYFMSAFDAEVRGQLSEGDLKGIIYSDGMLGIAELKLEFAELLRRAGPWGQGFPEPIFDGRFAVLDHRLLGERHLKLWLQVPGSQKRVEAIAFNIEHMHWCSSTRWVSLAYRLDVNWFRGSKNLQLVVEHLEPVPGA